MRILVTIRRGNISVSEEANSVRAAVEQAVQVFRDYVAPTIGAADAAALTFAGRHLEHPANTSVVELYLLDENDETVNVKLEKI